MYVKQIQTMKKIKSLFKFLASITPKLLLNLGVATALFYYGLIPTNLTLLQSALIGLGLCAMVDLVLAILSSIFVVILAASAILAVKTVLEKPDFNPYSSMKEVLRMALDKNPEKWTEKQIEMYKLLTEQEECYNQVQIEFDKTEVVTAQ